MLVSQNVIYLNWNIFWLNFTFVVVLLRWEARTDLLDSLAMPKSPVYQSSSNKTWSALLTKAYNKFGCYMDVIYCFHGNGVLDVSVLYGIAVPDDWTLK